MIINGFSKKIYGIEQNYVQKEFMISELHINMFVKIIGIHEISGHYQYQRIRSAWLHRQLAQNPQYITPQLVKIVQNSPHSILLFTSFPSKSRTVMQQACKSISTFCKNNTYDIGSNHRSKPKHLQVILVVLNILGTDPAACDSYDSR